MKRSTFTDEQIIAILKQAEAGLGIADLCRQHGISNKTLYRWRAKYRGMEASDAKKLRRLDEENRKLKQLVAELSLEVRVLKDLAEGNF